jgi:hypothetical protein
VKNFARDCLESKRFLRHLFFGDHYPSLCYSI